MSSLPPLNLRHDLEEDPASTITLNVRTVNVILLMLITVVRVFLTNPVTKRCWRCRVVNISFDYFDGAVCTPRLRPPTAIIAPDYMTRGRGASGKD